LLYIKIPTANTAVGIFVFFTFLCHNVIFVENRLFFVSTDKYISYISIGDRVVRLPHFHHLVTMDGKVKLLLSVRFNGAM
jgi:hypothetical protein